jgi:hypothetical protein
MATSGNSQLPAGFIGNGPWSRRDAARLLLAAAAAGYALPVFAGSGSLWQHIAHSTAGDSAEAGLADANWKPAFLSVPQEETLRAIAEVIVPGSSSARVSRFIDLLLSVDNLVPRSKFLLSLEALDKEALARRGKPFARLAAEEQNAVISEIASPPGGDQLTLQRLGHFEGLKEAVVAAYYSSEIGMRELGWTPDRVFAALPVCSHPEGHDANSSA